MHEELNLVRDLALILISAGVMTLICRWLKQPLILGYIVAGFLVGPHFGFFPDVAEKEVIEEWSELGIIFLLFALGLEFSFKKLVKVGSSALITAGINLIGMFVIGMSIGGLLHWDTMECIFLGGMMSMSSTTIIIKAFNDLGYKKQRFTEIVFGTLVVEDLLAILMMVLLSTVAVSRQFSGEEMLKSLSKLAFFLILWFLVGIYLIPTFLRKLRKIMNEETLLVLSIGLCFGMVVLASAAGFSSALGAFVMGSILAETIEGEHIEKLVHHIKDLFAAIFFVSVGMLVDPAILAQYWVPILVITVAVLVGKTIFSTVGVAVSGNSMKTSVQSGFALAQIGEFAFIIAALGNSLGVMREFIYPIIVSVSVVTTFTTPYLIKASGPAASWLSRKLPSRLVAKLEENATASSVETQGSDWKIYLRWYFLRIIVYVVLSVAISLAGSQFLAPFLLKEFSVLNPLTVKWITLIVTLLVMSPFLYSLAVQRKDSAGAFDRLWNGRKSSRGPLMFLVLLRGFLAVVMFCSVFFHYFKFSYWVLLMLALALGVFYLISKWNYKRVASIEKQFFTNLNSKEELERKKKPISSSIKSNLSGHDILVESVVVSPNSPYIGHRLRTVPFRTEFGVNLVKIIRGAKTFTLPSGEERVYPGDTLYAVGTKAQIAKFIAVMEADADAMTTDTSSGVKVVSFDVEKDSEIVGKALKDCNFREQNKLVIGVERGDTSIMNPTSDFVFELEDKVWVVKAEQSELKPQKARWTRPPR